VSGACALLAANLFLGNLNQDEGWYLYAARLVSQGQMPYRDFAFTQAPVLPLVYAWIQPWIQAGGLGAGRAFTALLGLAAALCASLLAVRLAPPERRQGAALISFILVLVNVYQSYYFTVVKTYSLTALFLVAGFLTLSVALTRRGGWIAAGAGVLLVLAGATRTSAGIVLPLAMIVLFLDRRRLAFHAWVYVGLGAVLAACIVVMPFWIMAPEAFRFFVLDYHTMRTAGALVPALVYKAGFLSRLIQGYFVATAVCIVVLIARWLGLSLRETSSATERTERSAPDRSMMRMIWSSIAAVSLIHLFAPFPYEDYQVFVYPLFALVVAVMAVRFVAVRAMPWLAAVILVLSLGSALSSPINQDWFVLGRDRIWWRMKAQSSLRQLRETGALLRTLSRPGAMLLTQDPYLAVESGLTLPHGLEMGQFSYFPDLSREQAQRLHVLNRSQLELILKTCPASVAAFSGYAFAIRSPKVAPLSDEEQAAFWRLVEARYELIGDIPCFGQAFTTLRIFKKKPSAPDPG